MQITVLEYLEHTARLLPDKQAFSSTEGAMTFSQVRAAARAVGSTLCEVCAGQLRRPVVVFQQRLPETIAALLGVVYSGNFYVALDPELPPERLQAIINTLSPAAVLTMSGELPPLTVHAPVIAYPDAAAHTVDDARLNAIAARITDQDPLYVLFTSGTTGAPKGVVTSHRAVIDYIDAFAEISHITRDDIMGSQAPLDYVAALRDIYLPLKVGAACVLLDKKLFSMPARLFDVLDEQHITMLCWVASAFCIPAKMNAFAYKVPTSVNKVIFTGAVMPSRLLRMWQQALPSALYINHYGPTEITASCTYAVIDHLVEADEVLPIGVPYRNTDILLLDENDREITLPGIIGELCVRGCGLALGYWGAPELTASCFVQNPANAAWPERIYRTGDYAHRDEHGVLWFHGRKDSQIKLMGHRVEMNEIEAAARNLEGVEEACCFYHEEREFLWLFIQGSATQAAIFTYLKARLPAFMIPRKLVVRNAFPRLANGKVDRRALKAEMEAAGHAKR